MIVSSAMREVAEKNPKIRLVPKAPKPRKVRDIYTKNLIDLVIYDGTWRALAKVDVSTIELWLQTDE